MYLQVTPFLHTENKQIVEIQPRAKKMGHLYRQISNISRSKSQNLNTKCFLSSLAIVFTQSIEARCQVGNEGLVGAAPTGDAPATSEWSTLILTSELPLILEFWRYVENTVVADEMMAGLLASPRH